MNDIDRCSRSASASSACFRGSDRLIVIRSVFGSSVRARYGRDPGWGGLADML